MARPGREPACWSIVAESGKAVPAPRAFESRSVDVVSAMATPSLLFDDARRSMQTLWMRHSWSEILSATMTNEELSAAFWAWSPEVRG